MSCFSILKKNVRLVYTQLNSASVYELAYEAEAPMGLPLKLYFSADKAKQHKYLKSATLFTDIKVKIYRGFLLKPDLFIVKKGESEKFSNYPIEEGSPKTEALVNLSKVVEYFKKEFSWNSFDKRGSDILATVKMGGMLKQNAAWVGAPYNQFVFGKDGKVLGNMTGGIDVIGHEYFHSIVSRTARLDSPGEHGALNEHLADMFGVGFESDIKNNTYDQKIGEAVVMKNKVAGTNIGLRDFLNPSQSLSEQAVTMSDLEKNFGKSCVPNEKNERCGVHYSNGVLNNVMGNFIKAKGWDNVKGLAFQVVAKRLRSNSDFLDYRNQLVEECGVYPKMSKSDCINLSNLFEKAGIAPVSSNQSARVDLDTCSVLKNICVMLKNYGAEMTEGCRQCGF